MTQEMLIETVGDETRIVVLRDGEPFDLFIERGARKSLVGNIYLGRVETVSKGIGAAFVDIGENKAGFLPLRMDRVPAEGEAVRVQVTRDGYREKGPQLTHDLSVAGRFLVYAPEGGRLSVSRQIDSPKEQERLTAVLRGLAQDTEGLIARTVSAGASEDRLKAELEALRATWAGIDKTGAQKTAPALLHRDLPPTAKAVRDHAAPDIDRIVIHGGEAFADAKGWCDIFAPEIGDVLQNHRGQFSLFDDYSVGEIFKSVTERSVPLASGGGIVIEPTEALTVIDVNSGRYLGGGSPRENALKINLEAAHEICRQIRLRNIGGMIIIDFIRLDDDPAWDEILETMRNALGNDRVPARLLGKTEAGLVEIIRRRTRPALSEILSRNCMACDGTGSEVHPEAAIFALAAELRQAASAGPLGPISIEGSPEIVECLSGAYGTGAGMAAAIGVGRALEWRIDPQLTGAQYRVSIMGHDANPAGKRND